MITYACDDGRTVRASYPDTDTAVVEVDGKSRTLKIAISASGARYTGDGVQWWTKGMAQAQLSPLAAGEDIASAPGVNCKAPEPAAAPVAPPPPGSPGGLPDDRTPISEGPFTPDSAQGAANVVQTYYALIGEKKYADAWKLWSDGGKASGMTQQAFAASFDKYASSNAQVGAPGDIEGGVGSLLKHVAAGKLANVRILPDDGRPLLDLCYDEDVNAEVDMNIVCAGTGEFIEVQGTAEGAPFDRGQLNELLDLGQLGCAELAILQQGALSEGKTA